MKKLEQEDVLLVFDRYYAYSIKGETRNSRAGKKASRVHKLRSDTPLPPQQVVLNVSKNKIQLIEIICDQLIEKVQERQQKSQKKPEHVIRNTLVVTSSHPVPIEVCKGIIIHREDMRTTHEEADVILAQQMVTEAPNRDCIKVLCDDTDVFVLLV